jgi:hypothetical protein
MLFGYDSSCGVVKIFSFQLQETYRTLANAMLLDIIGSTLTAWTAR